MDASPASTRNAAIAPIPSVFDLGRHLAALFDRQNVYDERVLASGEDSAARQQAECDHAASCAEIAAVEALILARPITSLADGAALAAVGFGLADYLTAVEREPGGYDADIERLRAVLARLHILLAGAAGLAPIVLMGSESHAAHIARHASTGEARS